jgi:hypothetical protein
MTRETEKGREIGDGLEEAGERLLPARYGEVLMAKSCPKTPSAPRRDVPFNKPTLGQVDTRRSKQCEHGDPGARRAQRPTLVQSLTARPVLDATSARTGLHEVSAGSSTRPLCALSATWDPGDDSLAGTCTAPPHCAGGDSRRRRAPLLASRLPPSSAMPPTGGRVAEPALGPRRRRGWRGTKSRLRSTAA